jgi:hypothetical protein
MMFQVPTTLRLVIRREREGSEDNLFGWQKERKNRERLVINIFFVL